MCVVAAFCWTCEKVESVQRRFTKCLRPRPICCINLAYTVSVWLILDFDRLELRRLRFDVIYVYKIFLAIVEKRRICFFSEYVMLVLPHADIALNSLCHSHAYT